MKFTFVAIATLEPSAPVYFAFSNLKKAYSYYYDHSVIIGFKAISYSYMAELIKANNGLFVVDRFNFHFNLYKMPVL